METLWWSLSILLVVVGLLGTVLPLLPGPVLILAGALLHRLTLGEGGSSVSWWTIGGLAVLTAGTYVLDFAAGAIGAKKFGATRWGTIGGLLGGVVGIFFGLPGILIGPLVGVLAGELLGGKKLDAAGLSTWGTFLGILFGTVGRFAIAVAMVAWWVWDAWPHR